MKFQSLFSGKIRETIISLTSDEFAYRMVKVKVNIKILNSKYIALLSDYRLPSRYNRRIKTGGLITRSVSQIVNS